MRPKEKCGFEIWIEDLHEEVQKKLLRFLKIRAIEDGNLDIIPIAIIPPLEIRQSKRR